MDLKTIHTVYLIGIGGIGMSALARYFKQTGTFVAGYDKMPTTLTSELIAEGIAIHFNDSIDDIPFQIIENKNSSLIIYTPAIPNDHKELNYFKNNNYLLKKRAEVLGMLLDKKKTIAIAGTHGKTTTSSIIAHILHNSGIGCTAFLGGILKNYNSNLLVSQSPYVVAEADEYDRSFLQLNPHIAVISAIDHDHFDIYHSTPELVEAFNLFASKIERNGKLILKKGLAINTTLLQPNVEVFTYSLNNDANFYPTNITLQNGLYTFDIHTPSSIIKNIHLGMPAKINIENATAAVAIAYLLDISETKIIQSLKTFTGIRRRFDIHLNTNNMVLIDDYAHHPVELKATIASARELFKGKKLTGIFQPHLYSRTRDLADEFAQVLSTLDELILLDIYPARELPIHGVTSKLIFDKITMPNKTMCSKHELMNVLQNKHIEVLMTLGAGDIDTLIPQISFFFKTK